MRLVTGHHQSMSILTCPLCGEEQNAEGPGVSSHREAGTGSDWISYWTPFIEDIRGTPERLVHPTCFVDENGLDALIALVTAHDQRARLAGSQSS